MRSLVGSVRIKDGVRWKVVMVGRTVGVARMVRKAIAKELYLAAKKETAGGHES